MTAAELRRWLSEEQFKLYCEAKEAIGIFMDSELSKDIIEALESLAECRRVMVEAVKLIKTWHNMNPLGHIADGMTEKAWEIYYNQAPEMKEIRECIAGYPREVPDEQGDLDLLREHCPELADRYEKTASNPNFHVEHKQSKAIADEMVKQYKLILACKTAFNTCRDTAKEIKDMSDSYDPYELITNADYIIETCKKILKEAGHAEPV